MKLSVVIPVLNQVDLASSVYSKIRDLTDMNDQEVEFIIIDNGSMPALEDTDFLGAKIVRNEKSIGVYPTFKQGFEVATGDVVAFFHSDLVIWEDSWNLRVMKCFEENPGLGMVGFIGSNEIDPSGGRGLGTTSNFAGLMLMSDRQNVGGDGKQEYPTWTGSHAKVHGKENSGASKAAVVDGCAMIIKREAWNDIGSRDNFPLHHFYDRLISTQLLEHSYDIYVLGIKCDHFSGQTVSKEQTYHDTAEAWCRANVPDTRWVSDKGKVNWDATIYQEAERQWIIEYRNKGLVPTRV